MKIPQVKLITY